MNDPHDWDDTPGDDDDDDDLEIEVPGGPVLIVRAVIADIIDDTTQQWLARCAGRLFGVLGLSDETEATIVITDDVEIRALNHEWRGKDEATDVLSFAYQEAEDGFVLPDLLGDIIISIETARRYAEEAHHATWLHDDDTSHDAWTLHHELAFLMGHGFLHLLGFDHIDPEDEKIMRPQERDVYQAVTAAEAPPRRATRLCPPVH